MADDAHSVEASNPVLGSLKVSGASINTIFTVFSFVLLVLLCWILWQHEVNARDSDKTVAASIVKSNEGVAKALEKLAESQDRYTEEQRKTNCLLELPQEQRIRCDRILRRDR